MSSLMPLIAGLLLEGIKAWNEDRRTRFMDEYKDLLSKIESMSRRQPKDWIDSDLAVAQKDLKIFLQAYAKEVGYVQP